ncbi:MAG: DedA family protein [Anaerolineae bacterium]|nr:DedA family protein [Anaerolineae bacterium]
MAEILDQLSVIIREIIMALGYPGISLVMLTENLFPPIPSELVMPFAGFLVAEGRLSFVGVMLAGTLGAVAGATALYYVGVWLDEPVIRRFVRRFGRYFLISEEDLDRALAFFDRYGELVIFFGRLIPIIRSLISIPAGMNRMPLPKFLVFTTLGATIWNTILTVGGWWLGANWEQIIGYIKQYERLTLVVLALAVVVFVVMRVRNLLSKRAAANQTK